MICNIKLTHYQKIGYDRPLGVVPELKEKTYHQEIRQASEDKVWRATMETMIKGIAPIRVLCHPEVRNIVSSHYAPADTNIANELREILRLTG